MARQFIISGLGLSVLLDESRTDQALVGQVMADESSSPATPISTDASVPAESLLAAQCDSLGPVELLGSAVAAAVTRIEALASMRGDSFLPAESVLAVTTDARLPAESLIAAAAAWSSAIESLVAAIVDTGANDEQLSAVQTDVIIGLESLLSAVSDSRVTAEMILAAALDGHVLAEFVAMSSLDTAIAIEQLRSVSVDAGTADEALSAVYRDAVVALESLLAAIPADSVIPAESLAATTPADATVGIESLVDQATDAIMQLVVTVYRLARPFIGQQSGAFITGRAAGAVAFRASQVTSMQTHPEVALVAGDTWQIPGMLEYRDGMPFNLGAGAAVQWQLRDARGNLVPGLDLSLGNGITVVDAATASVMIQVSPGATVIPPGVYTDQCRATDPAGVVTTEWHGAVRVKRSFFT